MPSTVLECRCCLKWVQRGCKQPSCAGAKAPDGRPCCHCCQPLFLVLLVFKGEAQPGVRWQLRCQGKGKRVVSGSSGPRRPLCHPQPASTPERGSRELSCHRLCDRSVATFLKSLTTCPIVATSDQSSSSNLPSPLGGLGPSQEHLWPIGGNGTHLITGGHGLGAKSVLGVGECQGKRQRKSLL